MPSAQRRKTSWWREHGLLVTNLALFAVFLVGLALAGWQAYSNEQQSHGESAISLGQYVLSPGFGEAVFENWESEFLQMGMYVVLTVFLFQRGSAESKPPDESTPQDEDPRNHRKDPHAPWPVRRGGAVLVLYEHSLAIFFFILFFASITLHAITGGKEFNAERLQHGEPAVSLWQYVGGSQFWFESFQNWQSEFLAVALIVWASVYLREKGSAESKPVHTPHAETST